MTPNTTLCEFFVNSLSTSIIYSSCFMFIFIGPASKTGCTAGATAFPVAAPSKLRHVGHHVGHVAST